MKGYIYCKEEKIEEIKRLNFSVKGTYGKKENTKYYVELCNGEDIVIDSISVPKTNYEHLKNQVSTFTQAMEYILKKVPNLLTFNIVKYERDTIWYYSRNLELSRRRIFEDITIDLDKEDFLDIIDRMVVKFNKEYNCEAFILGDMKDHICLKDIAVNRMRYEELRKAYNRYQDIIIESINKEGDI